MAAAVPKNGTRKVVGIAMASCHRACPRHSAIRSCSRAVKCPNRLAERVAKLCTLDNMEGSSSISAGIPHERRHANRPGVRPRHHLPLKEYTQNRCQGCKESADSGWNGWKCLILQ